MYKRIQNVRHGIIASQPIIDEEKMLQSVMAQRATGRLPPRSHVLLIKGPESDCPAFEDDDLDGLVTGLVDGDPGLFGETIALT